MHWCSSRGVVTVRGRRADAHNPKTNRGPATAQAPSGTPLCVGEERGLGGAPGQKESMLSLGRSHARQRPQRYSNPVSKRKTGIPAGRCKRLRNPTRARATTVWRGSNVSATAQSFFAGKVGCWLCHAPDVMPATAVPAGCPATTHHGQAGRILPHHAPLPRRRPDAAGSLPATDHPPPTDHPTHGSSRLVGRLPRMPHTFPVVDPQRSLRRADSPPPRLCGGRRGIRGSRMTFRVAAEQPGREWILAAGMQRRQSLVRGFKSARF